jgi:hypothetical protein
VRKNVLGRRCTSLCDETKRQHASTLSSLTTADLKLSSMIISIIIEDRGAEKDDRMVVSVSVGHFLHPLYRSCHPTFRVATA